LIAKDNQPTLREDIADYFEDLHPDRRRWHHAETWDKGHGRLEHRQIVCSPDLNEWFANDWQGIKPRVSDRAHGPFAHKRTGASRGRVRVE